jgi:sugar phosphate isomerase/epimerase
MKLGICNELFGEKPFEQVCEFVRGLGYEGLELAPFTFSPDPATLSAEARKTIHRVAELNQLAVIGLHWLLVKPPGLYITHPDAAIRRKTADYFKELVRLCHDLGGNVMIIGSPKQRSLLPGVTMELAMSYAVEVFRTSLESAERLGVTLAFEPLGPAETNFIQTAAEAIDLIHRINHPNFRLNLDVKAMSSEAKPIPEIIREAAPYIAHVQVNDPNLLGPGMGEVDHRPIIAALREVGYDGWLSVEAFDFAAGPERIARESLEYLRNVVTSSPAPHPAP